ncbi:MAG: DUF4446 family protein [Lachnospiraceae bacterium]|nr:DUF4446 family protein [Lachnospiraceae bacterium]MCR4596277.1 DUF4446 family protein [Lachnospiraceae bacterium]
MKYTILENMGLGNMDLSILLIILSVMVLALTVLTIILLVRSAKLKNNYRKFMTGKNVKSLESEIVGLFEDNKSMKEQINDNRRDIRSIYKQMRGVYQKCSINRYDAFQEMGGKLSFCLTLLNEDNDGFILNSVHSSAGCYNYLKQIKGGRCEIDLGAEEQKSLDSALNGGND